MIHKATILALPILIYAQVGFSGTFGLTHDSRANCGNNESISWDLTATHDMSASSNHYFVQGNFNAWRSKPWHNVQTGALYGVNRAAAVHWGESAPYSTNY